MNIKLATPKDAFEMLKNQKNSFLVDVRTNEEFNFVGMVDASQFENRILLNPWQVLPQMQLNPNFSNNLTSQIPLDATLFFLCKTGGRSAQSAEFALGLGYQNCYNVVNGFEGDLNDNSQRGTINGWKASNLPWRQR
ncbi:MAG: rhodanese-like domain-containing protein [Alphaproteobacteria bacterium]